MFVTFQPDIHLRPANLEGKSLVDFHIAAARNGAGTTP
jgi:hypothetical protein